MRPGGGGHSSRKRPDVCVRGLKTDHFEGHPLSYWGETLSLGLTISEGANFTPILVEIFSLISLT